MSFQQLPKVSLKKMRLRSHIYAKYYNFMLRSYLFVSQLNVNDFSYWDRSFNSMVLNQYYGG